MFLLNYKRFIVLIIIGLLPEYAHANLADAAVKREVEVWINVFVHGIKSVTIISANAEIADAMATPVMIMGIKVGLDMVNQVKGLACIIVDDNDNIYTSKNINLR